ncbi:Netrin-A [Eufriesea mexicana]|uniref:Netrin-A n=1 Tax=Eufriesea mexicana TaxID=516756 RepID=A0A310S6H2_9HYME|nr:Netrin-A [Eufriesea mexicana]
MTKNIIQISRSYLILGQESDGGGQGGLTVTQRSIVIEWRDEWHHRMRRLKRRARSCHRTNSRHTKEN